MIFSIRYALSKLREHTIDLVDIGVMTITEAIIFSKGFLFALKVLNKLTDEEYDTIYNTFERYKEKNNEH